MKGPNALVLATAVLATACGPATPLLVEVQVTSNGEPAYKLEYSHSGSQIEGIEYRAAEQSQNFDVEVVYAGARIEEYTASRSSTDSSDVTTTETNVVSFSYDGPRIEEIETVSTTIVGDADPVIFRSSNEYSYDGNQLSEVETRDTPAVGDVTITTTEYTYDGPRIEETETLVQGQDGIRTVQYSYGDGNRLEEVEQTVTGVNTPTVWEFSYDNQGRIEEVERVVGSDIVTWEVSYDGGLIAEVEQTTGSDRVVWGYFYDAGNVQGGVPRANIPFNAHFDLAGSFLSNGQQVQATPSF